MELKQIRQTPSPKYPSYLEGIAKKARKVGKVAAVAAALGLAGCGAMTDPVGAASAQEDSARARAVELALADAKEEQMPIPGGMAPPQPPPTPLPYSNMQRCQSYFRIAGSRAFQPRFVCGPDVATSPILAAPTGVTDGNFCNGGPSFVRVQVNAPLRARISHTNPHLVLALISQNGGPAVQLTPTQSCVELTMSPGVWTFVATPTAGASPTAGFFFYFDAIAP